MPRSGTTVIGQRLCGQKDTCELYEPFNTQVGDIRIRDVFPLIGTNNMSISDAHLIIARVKQGGLRARWPNPSTGRNPIFNRTRRSFWRARFDPRIRNVIWKDPFALFLADWIARNTDIPVIFSLRSPLAIAASFSRMGWELDIDLLAARLIQCGLASQTTQPFENVSKPVLSAIYLWHLVHLNVAEWIANLSPITWVNIEDNIHNPEKVAMQLNISTGLVIAPAQEIEPHDPAKQHIDKLPQKAHIKNRTAFSISNLWQKQLSTAEIVAVESVNGPLWRQIQATHTR